MNWKNLFQNYRSLADARQRSDDQRQYEVFKYCRLLTVGDSLDFVPKWRARTDVALREVEMVVFPALEP
jgi:hypothetical protein